MRKDSRAHGTLANVVWIGGSPCAGKSSVADAIARECGWAIYRCDDEVSRHARLADPVRQPIFTWLNQLTCDELWMRPVDRQTAEEVAYYREEFAFILDDLAQVAAEQPVIAEGAALLPENIDPRIVRAGRAVWIVPTPEFQREHYAQRDWTAKTLACCSDRETAWQNWMERDVRFARHVREAAEYRGYPVVMVDGTRGLDETIAVVGRLLRLSLRLPAK